MDVRDFIAASAAEFWPAPRDWLTFPSVSAGGLDADQVHAPNGYVDLSPRPRCAESTAYQSDELAGPSGRAEGGA
jgi:hypothetical protein